MNASADFPDPPRADAAQADSPLTAYDAAAVRAAHQVIAKYSTSFSLATGLLRGRVREDIRTLYAVVRIADEIVDGAAAQAGDDTSAITARLAAYEKAVLAAPDQRLNTDLILHAYGITARRCQFDPEHIRAFFASMRRDITQRDFTDPDYRDYIYGSAEVIGLLCLEVFYADKDIPAADYAELAHGARRLGAAFQKVNFLRDLAADCRRLGRSYFPQVAAASEPVLSDATKANLIAEIRADLAAARTVMDRLPYDARLGVIAATDIFAELTDRLDALPAAEVARRRVRIPAPKKAAIIAAAAARTATRTAARTATRATTKSTNPAATNPEARR